MKVFNMQKHDPKVRYFYILPTLAVTNCGEEVFVYLGFLAWLLVLKVGGPS